MNIGPHQFESRLLMPDYRSERHPNGAVLELTPKEYDFNLNRLIVHAPQEIIKLAREYLALVLCLDTSMPHDAYPNTPWSKVRESEKEDRLPLFFHTDGLGEAIILTHEGGPLQNRTPTYVVEFAKLKAAMMQHKNLFRNAFGDAKPDNIDDFTEQKQSKIEVFYSGTRRYPEFAEEVFKTLRHQNGMYEHRWAELGKRTALVMPNNQYDIDNESGITWKTIPYLHARPAHTGSWPMDTLYRKWIGYAG